MARATKTTPTEKTTVTEMKPASAARPGRGRIYDSITDTIGDTPLVRLDRIAGMKDVRANLLAKLEFFNPMASVKDRIGVSMIDAMEADGTVHEIPALRVFAQGLAVRRAERRLRLIERLDSERFRAFAARAREWVDAGPPEASSVPGGVAPAYAVAPRIIARWVDGVIVVVGAHQTPRRLIAEALNVIGPAKMMGFVFNGEDHTLSRYLPGYYEYDATQPSTNNGSGGLGRALRKVRAPVARPAAERARSGKRPRRTS